MESDNGKVTETAKPARGKAAGSAAHHFKKGESGRYQRPSGTKKTPDSEQNAVQLLRDMRWVYTHDEKGEEKTAGGRKCREWYKEDPKAPGSTGGTWAVVVTIRTRLLS